MDKRINVKMISKKLICALVSFAMVITMIPMISGSAYAAEVTGDCDKKGTDSSPCSFYSGTKCHEYCTWRCSVHSEGGVAGQIKKEHVDGVQCELCGNTIYRTVQITGIEAPETGFSLDKEARVKGKGLVSDSVENPLIDGSLKVKWKAGGEEVTDPTAEADTVYTAEMTVCISSKYADTYFSENLSAYVNGQSAELTKSGSTVTVSYTFAKTGETRTLFDDCMGNVTAEQPVYRKGREYTVHDSVKYTFGGWFTAPNGEGKEVNTGFKTGNTYYAKWISEYDKTVVTSTLNFRYNPVSDVPSDSGITWNSDTGTLNLDNAVIDTVESKGVILPEGAAAVKLVNDSVISSRYSGEIPYFEGTDAKGANYIAGIFCAGNLTVEGKGTLDVSGGEINDTRTLVCSSDAIWAKGDIDIQGITLNAECGNVNAGDASEEGGGGYDCGSSIAIFGKKEIHINNATVNAKSGSGGGDDHNGFSMGIHSLNSLTVTDSKVTATGGNAAQDSAGIFAGPDYGTEPNAYGESNQYLGDISITGSTVTAKSGKAENFTSDGIYAHNSITVKNSTVTAENGKGNSEDATNAAIFRNEKLVVDNSRVEAAGYGGGIDTYAHSNEVRYKDAGIKNVVFGETEIKNNSSVKAKSLDAVPLKDVEPSEYNPALMACNELSISDSTLTCESGSYENAALLFIDPGNSVTDGLYITGSGKIVTDGTVGGFVKNGDKEFYKYNLGSDANSYYVTGSETESLNGTENTAVPKEGQIMVIGTGTPKYAPVSDDFIFTAPSNLIADGTPKRAAVTAGTGVTGMGDITVKYYDRKGNLLRRAPVNAGKYTVKIDVAEGDSYVAGTDITDSTWTFTVVSAPTPTPVTKYTVAFDNQGHGAAPQSQSVEKGGKVSDPGSLTEEGYEFGGWFTDKECTDAWDFDKDTVTENITLYAKWTENPQPAEPKEAFIATGTAKKTTNIIRWNAVEDADGYDVYYAKCGNSLKKIKTTTARKYTKKSLNKKKVYKYRVRAYKKVEGKKVYLAATPVIHIAGVSAKYSNASEVIIHFEGGETDVIRGEITKKSSSKKVLWKNHVSAEIRYMSSDSSVIAVDSKGIITAKGKGKAYLYAYAASGAFAKLPVIVENR